MSEQNVESVEVLLDVLLEERAVRLGSVESLDTKAGILLGFDAVIVAYAATLGPLWERLVLILLALLSAGLALWALGVRRYPMFDGQATRDSYITRSAPEVRRVLLDTLVGAHLPSIEGKIKTKAICTVVSTFTLGAAVVFMSALAVVRG